jgi:hypothetical protein
MARRMLGLSQRAMAKRLEVDPTSSPGGNRESGAVTELGRRLRPVSLDHQRVVALTLLNTHPPQPSALLQSPIAAAHSCSVV